jgi:hypothetical protein
MNIPVWVQDVLLSFENRTDAYSEVAIVDALDVERRNHGDLSDEDFKGYVAERSSFMFRGQQERSVWNTFYGPLLVATRTDGTEVRTPDIRIG